jgi:AraC family transcriptional regulator
LTIVPLGTQYLWRTRGPIEFAHLYLAPSLLDKAALHLDHARSFSLIEHVGCRQPLLESIFAAILSELRLARRANGLYLDCLLESFVFTLLHECSTASIRERKNREKLTAFRLARMLEFIESNLDRKITLDDLVSINGSSAFHFSRAFKNSVGEAPHRFVLRRRIERAKQLLAGTDLPLGTIAARCGFMDRSHFSKSFARIAGASPRRFRQGQS